VAGTVRNPLDTPRIFEARMSSSRLVSVAVA
jgi:hypothetical protein